MNSPGLVELAIWAALALVCLLIVGGAIALGLYLARKK